MTRFYVLIFLLALALAVATAALSPRAPAPGRGADPPPEVGVFPGEVVRDVSPCPHPPGLCPRCSLKGVR